MKRLRNGCLSGLLLLAGLPCMAQVPVEYEVFFDASWSAETHPDSFPGGAHWSPLTGGTHQIHSFPWGDGLLASTGVELVAETGSRTIFENEILVEAAAGRASSDLIQGSGTNSPGSVTTTFTVTPEFPRVTLITMIAPSPDWFAGTAGLPLFQGGRYRDGLIYSLQPYDAGSDDGTNYTSSNAESTPHVPVFEITGFPFEVGNSAPPVGSYTFTIIGVDGLPPYEDQDGDGLSNLREAELGSDPRLANSDSDSLNDNVDNCPLLANALQDDTDADGTGDICDNCTSLANTLQVDNDFDGEGDLCDTDDGFLHFTTITKGNLQWQDDSIYTGYSVYRGDLAALRSTGEYTQDETGDVPAKRFCSVSGSTLSDPYTPAAGEAVFYLVTGDSGSSENDLGRKSSGHPRINTRSCT